MTPDQKAKIGTVITFATLVVLVLSSMLGDSIQAVITTTLAGSIGVLLVYSAVKAIYEILLDHFSKKK